MSAIRYISTRGETEPMGFEDAALAGLAPDGGLLIPDRIPDAGNRLAGWSDLAYPELAFEVLRLFADCPDEVLLEMVRDSYASFRNDKVAPVVAAGSVHILELFHGPTLAFKDFALQFLSRFFEYALDRRDRSLNILGATSGDTGSAAIHGVRGRRNMRIFMMHPQGRVAPLQERQMTTVLDDNVFNMSIDGTFDDCQQIMKGLFADLSFKDAYSLGAVNSVNWVRVAAQIVYYLYAALNVQRATGADEVSFAVPTGNFGDILAGWYAHRMGAPIRRLVLASNQNDILARFFATGTYARGDVVETLSPSMDIQVASNFERYLYYRLGESAPAVREAMGTFARTGSLSVAQGADGATDSLIRAGVGDREATLETIARYHRDCGMVLDPHTAVGVSVAESYCEVGVPMVCLATAHPAKFSAAIREAIGGDAHHPILNGLLDAETRCAALPKDPEAVRAFVARHAPRA